MRYGERVVAMRSLSVFFAAFLIGCARPHDPAAVRVPVEAGGSGGRAPAGRSSGGAGSMGERITPPAAAGAGGSATTGRPSRAGDAPPCDVQAVLQTACQGCHAREPGALAPMALLTRQDFAAPAVSDPGRTVHELAALRLRDEQRPMPPPTSRRPMNGARSVSCPRRGGASPPA